LITLTGPGGVGKTRVAIAAAGGALRCFPAGVWFVDLTPLTEPAHVAVSIAHMMGGDVGHAKDPLVTIAERSRDRTLLILDSFEHLSAAALIVDTLLATCPRLTVLVTSRERLHLRRERIVEVRPLPVPDDQRSSWTAGELQAIPAVQLFVERAQAIDSRFTLSDENAVAVAEMTRQLDGLPLALELAAARTRFLDPIALLTRMKHSLTLLRCEACDLPARHRTLRSNLDWSYALLDAEEQAVFRRLGSFAGAFTLEDMSAVAETDELERDALEILATLTDKHLVEVLGRSAGAPHFRLLMTAREYARERLVASGEADWLRHSDVERESPKPERSDRRVHHFELSPREREVLALVAGGHSNRAIADALFVTTNTIKTHVTALLTKLGVHNRTQLATKAIECALLPT
jgi:predicted ATPase/DNA-binding CsgD family transcriptional regulator